MAAPGVKAEDVTASPAEPEENVHEVKLATTTDMEEGGGPLHGEKAGGVSSSHQHHEAGSLDDAIVEEFARNSQMEAHDWHNRTRDVVLALISIIPTVGAIASVVLGIFWPANKVDIWVALSLEEYVRNIVKQEIFEFEMRQHQSSIEALESTIRRYNTAALPEKGNFLSIWISQADALCIRLRNSTNDIHLLLHIVTVSVLHMAAMHERLTFGEELYGTDNTANWTRDLVEVFQMYTSDLIPSLFRKWKQWREGLIEIRSWVVPGRWGNLVQLPDVSHATVEDKLTGAIVRFSVARRNSTTIFLDVCQDHKSRMANEAVADMASCMSSTFAFRSLLPDRIQGQYPAYDRELFGQVFRGPYSQDHCRLVVTEFRTFRTRPTHFDQTAIDRVSELIVMTAIHFGTMQFVYFDNNSRIPGLVAGNASGGGRWQRHVIDVLDKPIRDLRLEFNNEALASLQLSFEDGSSTPRLGNFSGSAEEKVTCTVPRGYRLSSWAFRADPAISVLRFQFTPEELRPSSRVRPQYTTPALHPIIN
nr:insecticidal protein IPD113 [Blechnum occidentale]